MSLPKSYLRNKERFIITHKSQRSYLQAMIVEGLKWYDEKESSCVILTDVVTTCSQLKATQTKTVQQYIMVHANVHLVRDKQSNIVFRKKKDKDSEGVVAKHTPARITLPVVPYWEHGFNKKNDADTTWSADKRTVTLIKDFKKNEASKIAYELAISKLTAAMDEEYPYPALDLDSV